MEDGTRNLTVTLLIFEATDGKKTLTDALAKAFVSLFNPDSAWHASIDRDGGHAEGAGDGNPATGDHSHYVLKLAHRTLDIKGRSLEAAKEAVERLCREFCDPNGPLSPRQISPNPNLIFTVQVSPNSPTDDLFLSSFVKRCARYAMPEEPLVSRSQPGVISSMTSTGLGVLRNLVKFAGGTVPEKDKSVGAADEDITEQTASAIDQARVLFAEMDHIQRQNNRLVASAELQSAKQHFEDLRGTVFAMASRRGDAEVRQKDASMALCHFFLMATASLALLHPAVAGTLAAQIPDVVSRFQDLAGNVMTLAPTLPLGGFQQALHFKSEAEAAGDVTTRLRDTGVTINRRLYIAVIAALRSDYRYHPNAAEFARLVMNMAATVDLEALEGWSDGASSIRSVGLMNRRLDKQAKDCERRGGRG